MSGFTPAERRKLPRMASYLLLCKEPIRLLKGAHPAYLYTEILAGNAATMKFRPSFTVVFEYADQRRLEERRDAQLVAVFDSVMHRSLMITSTYTDAPQLLDIPYSPIGWP